jgi:ABC-2 type transport system permease protein
VSSQDLAPSLTAGREADVGTPGERVERRLPRLRPPSFRLTLGSLLRADFVTQGRNVAALLGSLVLPVVYLIVLSTGKRAVALGGVHFGVASSLVGGMALNAVAGYSLTLARHRELGVFQRLRVAPIPSWEIMVSRIIVQVAAVLGMAVIVLVAAVIGFSLRLSAGAWVLTLVIVMVSAAEFLGIGQAIVGLIRSSETVRAIAPVVFIPLFVLSIFAHVGRFGSTFEIISRWSPGGVIATILAGAMQPGTWTLETWGALAATIGYAAVFAGVGIRWFKWTSR